jgi:hypothetical protein
MTDAAVSHREGAERASSHREGAQGVISHREGAQGVISHREGAQRPWRSGGPATRLLRASGARNDSGLALRLLRASGARNDSGIALLLAIAVLAALGTIALTAFTLARAERMAGLAAVARVQARAAAEAALAQASLGWPGSLTPVVPGDSVRLTQVSVPGPARGEAWLRALGGPIHAITASGIRLSNAGEPLGTVRLELLVLLIAADSAGIVRPLNYPRGLRLLP